MEDSAHKEKERKHFVRGQFILISSTLFLVLFSLRQSLSGPGQVVIERALT